MQKDLLLQQLKALAKVKIEEAQHQKRFAGRISPDVVAEIYRIGHQILAALEDKTLNPDDPSYLFGLYTALLKLHKSNYKTEQTLYGQPSTRTVCEIARLESLLEELKAQYSPPKPDSKQSAASDVQAGLQKLLT